MAGASPSSGRARATAPAGTSASTGSAPRSTTASRRGRGASAGARSTTTTSPASAPRPRPSAHPRAERRGMRATAARSRTVAVGSAALHQHLAHQHRVEPGAGHAARVVDRPDRALGDRDHVGRAPALASRSPTLRSSANVPRLRAFTPTMPRADRRARVRARRRRGSRRAPPSPSPTARSCRSREERVVGQRGDDQQQRVGADGAGLVDLHLVDGEVLAQHRELARGPRGVQVVDGAAELRPVGEHRQARGAAGARRPWR